MIFKETKLKGAYVIDIEKLEDERGFLPVHGVQTK
jgi:dTDP-4-dehydrorhamnose 3,5-epimerase-like enzyme